MKNIIIGIFIGLVLSTFRPHAASISRNLFNVGAETTITWLDKTSEAVK